jgi:hypothetical protein
MSNTSGDDSMSRRKDSKFIAKNIRSKIGAFLEPLTAFCPILVIVRPPRDERSASEKQPLVWKGRNLWEHPY